MRLIANDEVPSAVGRLQLLLYVLVAGELVEPRNDEVRFKKPVAGARSFQLVVGQNFERQIQTAVELILPLLGEASGADNETSLNVAPGDQLPDQEPCHDGLAGARVVCEQEAQRLARQHAFVDGRDLVRQRLDDRILNGEHRIEKMRETDALGLGHEPEQSAIPVEAPRPPFLDDLQVGLAVAVDQLVAPSRVRSPTSARRLSPLVKQVSSRPGGPSRNVLGRHLNATCCHKAQPSVGRAVNFRSLGFVENEVSLIGEEDESSLCRAARTSVTDSLDRTPLDADRRPNIFRHDLR